MPLDDTAFETLADETLERLARVLDDAVGDVADIDLRGGILTVELDSGGSYVINRHAPNRQIWMASPASGASHYAWNAATGTWADTRDGAALDTRLYAELRAKTGRPIGPA